MNRVKWLLAGSLLAFGALPSSASAESLLEAMASAYGNNPTLLSQRAALHAIDETVPQALSGWRPSVQLRGDVGISRTWTDTPVANDILTSTEPRSISVTVSQPLYTGGRVAASIRAAENAVLASRADLAAVEQRVLSTVATAYMDVLRDEAVLELTTMNVQVLQRQLQAAQDRFRVGEITRTDVAQAEARVARSVADRVRAEGQLQASRAAYQASVGHAPAGLERPQGLLRLPATLDEVVAQAAEANPTVRAFGFAARAAEAGVDQVRGELYPVVALNATASTAWDAGTPDVDRDSVTAGLSVTVPLYTAGATYSRVREQKHNANRRRIQIHEARRNAVQSATQAWETWQASRARSQSLTAQIAAAQIALEGVQREAQVGSRTILDVLDSEQEFLDSRVNLVVAQRDEMVAGFQVMQAIGRLTAPDLGLPVDLYDPTAHYSQVRDKWVGTAVDLVPEQQ